jgi:hypothetical protein
MGEKRYTSIVNDTDAIGQRLKDLERERLDALAGPKPGFLAVCPRSPNGLHEWVKDRHSNTVCRHCACKKDQS